MVAREHTPNCTLQAEGIRGATTQLGMPVPVLKIFFRSLAGVK
jgi:hypothetical protein